MWNFTQNEQRALLFLISTFVIGLGVQLYQKKFQPFPSVSSVSFAQEEPALVVSSSQGETEVSPSFKFDLNHASADELEKIPGIGPALAQRILEWREAHGPFRQIEELLEVKGIGTKTLEKMRPFLYIPQAE